MTFTPDDSVISLSNARVIYGHSVVGMDSTSVSFKAGEFVVLLGPSGAGKSTLLRSLNGLVPLTEGTLHTDGGKAIDTPAELRAHRRKTAMVFQQHQLIGRLTALDNVLTGRLGHHSWIRTMFPLPREKRLLALDALDQVGLLDRALTRVDQTSYPAGNSGALDWRAHWHNLQGLFLRTNPPPAWIRQQLVTH